RGGGGAGGRGRGGEGGEWGGQDILHARVGRVRGSGVVHHDGIGERRARHVGIWTARLGDAEIGLRPGRVVVGCAVIAGHRIGDGQRRCDGGRVDQRAGRVRGHRAAHSEGHTGPGGQRDERVDVPGAGGGPTSRARAGPGES